MATGPTGEGIEVLFYREDDGTVPLLEWLDGLQVAARDRCVARIALLAERGHELGRPHAAYLGDDIYELRIKFYRVNYRILYFFHGRGAVVISHGLAKEARVPPREIDAAVRRRDRFVAEPARHTFRPGRG